YKVSGMLRDKRPESQSARLRMGLCQQRRYAGDMRRRHAGAADGVVHHGTRPTGAHVSTRSRNVDLSPVGIKSAVGEERHVDVPIQSGYSHDRWAVRWVTDRFYVLGTLAVVSRIRDDKGVCCKRSSPNMLEDLTEWLSELSRRSQRH